MIYIIGDTHGDLRHFSKPTMVQAKEPKWTEKDTLIICGDFGFIWAYPEDEEEYRKDQERLDTLAKKPYKILFVDGNHENFEMLYSYPLEEGFGGTVRRIRDNIFHLQRGQVYTIGGHTFFTFGGAATLDAWRRQRGVSWWPELEMPTAEEMEAGRQALERVDHQVDYIVTHTAPKVVVKMMRFPPAPEEGQLTEYFNEIWKTTAFEMWYFGHFHVDWARPVGGCAVPLMDDVIAIPEKKA
ncbi:MAG: metallophosphoesterase [Clostridia bacterium]|nr:metallophosphoesterase [Clostridia bacterium]